MIRVADNDRSPPRLPLEGAQVDICEVWFRDGIQGWPKWIDTADKIRVLRAVIDAGVPEIDATSFVSAKIAPQFADGLEVLAAADERVRLRVLTVNMKGVESVIAAHKQVRRIERCGIPFSTSEPHNLANLRRNHADHRVVVAEMIQALQEAGIEPLLGVSTAFGCPIQGRVDPNDALAIAEWGYGLGVRAIMFGDTTGLANPRAVAQVFSAASATFPDADLIAHLHDNRGAGVANSLAAIGAGATTVDTCLGGMGGEPVAIDQGVVGDQGNTTTEDLVVVLDNMGVKTGVDLDALVAAGAIAESVIGRALFSKVQRAGLLKVS